MIIIHIFIAVVGKCESNIIYIYIYIYIYIICIIYIYICICIYIYIICIIYIYIYYMYYIYIYVYIYIYYMYYNYVLVITPFGVLLLFARPHPQVLVHPQDSALQTSNSMTRCVIMIYW